MTVDEITRIIFKGNEKRLVVLNNPHFFLTFYLLYKRYRIEVPEILYVEDYHNYEHKNGDVVFVEIPRYREELLDKIDFDFDEFFKWARKIPYKIYFVNGKLPVPSFPTCWEKWENGVYKETLYANRAI